MAALMPLAPGERMHFVDLRDMLKLTDGNLGAHLLKLEAEDLVKVDKEFISRKPRTFISLSARGKSEFEDYIRVLNGILSASQIKPSPSRSKGGKKPEIIVQGVHRVPNALKG